MTERTHPRRLTRRDFLTWAGVGATGAILAACGPAPTPEVVEKVVTKEVEKVVKETVVVEETVVVKETVPVEVTAVAEPVTIEMWWGNWGDFYNDLMKVIGDDFTKNAAPHITVKWVFAEEWREKLLTSVAAGTPPDCCYTDIESNATLMDQGVFVPLDGELAKSGLGQKDFIPAQWDASQWEGKLYALPGGADARLLVYNKDLYREVGLDPEKPPKTFDEFMEHSLKSLKYDAAGNIERIGYTPNESEMQYWVPGFGGEWYDPVQKKVTANHPGVVEAFEWMFKYIDEMGVEKLTAWRQADTGSGSDTGFFPTGKMALLGDGFWVYQTLNEFAPKMDYGMGFWPTRNGTVEDRALYNVGGWMVAIPTGARRFNEAWQFLKYGFVDNAWEMGCHTLNGCSVVNQMDKMSQCLREQIGENDRFYPYVDINNETLLAGTRHWPVIQVAGFYWDELQKAAEAIFRGAKPAQEALDELTTVVQAELDRALEEI